MISPAPIPPITGTTTVAVPLLRAFEVFTGSINAWWPHQYHIGQADIAEVILELTDLLATLTPQQWDAPSLCTRWRVRDVVAHVYSYGELDWARVAVRMTRNRFNTDRANAIGLAAFAATSNDDLLAHARNHIQPRGLTALMGGRIALTDGMIHHQDIRRPLRLPRDIPADRLIAALDAARTAPTLAAAKRIRGLTLNATDLAWTTGDGPTIEGPGEALLMAIAGRDGITPELSGPGVAILAERIAH